MDNIFFKMTIKNSIGEINLGKYEEYRIEEVEGLESIARDINIDDNYRADGGKVKYRKLKERDISLKADFKGINPEEERQKLIRMFNSKETLILMVYRYNTVRIIECEVDSFKLPVSNIYEPLELQLDLIAPNPYFEDENEKLVDLINWIDGVSFPIKLPFKLKQKGTTRVNVINEGHIETPLTIYFKGPAKNPKVINSTTGEFIRVKRDLTADDTLIINTEFGNKTVEILKLDGSIENAFNYIDLSSTFFRLKPGNNILEYSTDSLEPSGVQIRYKNKYSGI